MSLSLFGLFGLVIAATGIFSVVEQATRRRTSEIGLRQALGATRVRIARMLVMRTGIMVIAGTLLGGLLSIGANRLVADYLGQTARFDTTVLFWVTFAVLLIGAASCALPIHRAIRLDIGRSLRQE